MYKNADYIQLVIRTTPGGRMVWLKCLKETAAFYGWDKAFPTINQAREAASIGGLFSDPGRRGWKNGGGEQHRICRSPLRAGLPAGQTNAFRVSLSASNNDLRAIARATTAEWHWMSCKNGGRKTREQWLEESTTSR